MKLPGLGAIFLAAGSSHALRASWGKSVPGRGSVCQGEVQTASHTPGSVSSICRESVLATTRSGSCDVAEIMKAEVGEKDEKDPGIS